MPDQSIGALTGGELTWSDDRSWHFSAVPNRAERCPVSGVDQPTYAECRLLHSLTRPGHRHRDLRDMA